MYYFQKCIVSQYKKEDNKLIFYPNNFKQGYVASEEQINQVKKSFKKLYFFNILGYKKDVEKIFAQSEKVTIPLDRQIYRNNLARITNWFEISFLLAINFVLIGLKHQDIVFVVILLVCTLICVKNIVITKLRQK